MPRSSSAVYWEMADAERRIRDLYISDNLPVLRGLNSDTVDLIYLDPPFNSKKEYRAPIGSEAEGQMFDDTSLLSQESHRRMT